MVKRVFISGINTATLPKITYKEANDLLYKIKQDDEQAKDYFFMCNIRLVLSITQRFMTTKENVNDVFQVGCLGLLKAIDNFDLSVGVRFSTYAVPMIVGEIKRFLRDNSAMRVSRSLRDTAYKVLKSKERLSKEYDDVSLEQVALDLNITLKEVIDSIDALADPISLSDPVYTDGEDAITMQDSLVDNISTTERLTNNLDLADAIRLLEPRERQILSMRYFSGKTQMEVSDSVGISQAQVSRLEKNALNHIKRYFDV